LCLKGDRSHLIGKIEDLHLAAIQNYRRLAGGEIRYLNTAAAAIRRNRVAHNGRVFNPKALRAQDTLLLADLMRSDELPQYVPDAIILHNVRLSISRYLLKALRTGYTEGRTYQIIDGMGINIRATGRERFQLLLVLLGCVDFGDVVPLFFVTLRQGLALLGSLSYRCSSRGSTGTPFETGLSQPESRP